MEPTAPPTTDATDDAVHATISVDDYNSYDDDASGAGGADDATDDDDGTHATGTTTDATETLRVASPPAVGTGGSGYSVGDQVTMGAGVDGWITPATLGE
jgi:hypothetical protein